MPKRLAIKLRQKEEETLKSGAMPTRHMEGFCYTPLADFRQYFCS